MKSNKKPGVAREKQWPRPSSERKKERSLTFYCQVRVDGGIHTGINIEGTDTLEHYQEGDYDFDNALLYFVDVRCVGKDLPTDPIKVWDWFLQLTPLMKTVFGELADKLEAGFDRDARPYQWQVPQAPAGIRITIVCHAISRLVAREMAPVLRDFGERWEVMIRSLELVKDRIL